MVQRNAWATPLGTPQLLKGSMGRAIVCDRGEDEDGQSKGADVIRSFLSLPWVICSNLGCKPLVNLLPGQVLWGSFVPNELNELVASAWFSTFLDFEIVNLKKVVIASA